MSAFPDSSHAQSQVTESGSDDSANIADIMTRIRSLVAEKLATPREKFQPTSVAELNPGQAPLAGEMLHSPELRVINQRHAYSLDVNPKRLGCSHRRGLLGRLVTFVKRGCLVFLRDKVLVDYLKSEHEFQSALTQYLNAMTRYVDQRDSADFWNLVHKIDVDTEKCVERIDRIADEVHGSLATLRREIEEKGKLAGSSGVALSNTSAPLSVSPAMTPQMAALVQQVNLLAHRVDELSKNAKV